ASLKSKLRYQERTAKEGFFGSSTPSSKLPIKPNSKKEQHRNRGGGKVGHQGHGRASIREEDADKVEKIPIGNICPDCGSTLEQKGTKARTVIDCQPIK
ncbi:MAG: IS66 family transposase, partial [Phycisphaerae bacterium]|nr:IS66 family transposase [Phycisphaerae bacterium]NIP55767.1 IS66 family transposase [Phycisphaerae bacterium]NIS54415.1 IS66 family transposase [Phycisphaerae bacterium]NIU11867.1 IS66 family transposase [Phycisphaerae bacterium]NIU57542.1 IS66 family transposase [Phycisphaerae bacterium]